MHSRAELLAVTLQADLYAAGWENSGLYPGISLSQVAMSSLNNAILKKFHNDEVDEVRDNAALQLFLECNEHCRKFDSVVPRHLDEEYIIGEMKSLIDDFFNPTFWGEENSSDREPLLLNLSDIAKNFGLGSGSNIGATSTDFYTKLVNSSMSHTNELLPILFKQALSIDPLWADVEAFRSNKLGYESVRGSRLSFVPKSQTISRTICTEPLLNMLFQKGIAGVMERRLKSMFSIDFSVQPFLNSKLARLGSVEGSFGTIDLSSASDTISLRMLEEMLPRQPMDWLKRCRSPNTTLPGGSELELHMFSSMGNGFTFPLQTMLFACLVIAAYRIYGIPIHYSQGSTPGNFAVFGDDIIVDKRVYNSVVRCLAILGFSVNNDKSFNQGLFRESCGTDYYQGLDVRGVYVKTLLHAGDYYSAINRLNRWSAKHCIFLPRTIKLLRRGCRFLGVPYDEADDAGVKVPLTLLTRPKYNANGAIKYLARVNLPLGVSIPSIEADGDISVLEVHRVRRSLPGFIYLGDGLMLCLLAGWLRNGSLGLRSANPKAVLRRRVCPGWDERIAAVGVSQQYEESWKAFSYANLVS